LVTVAGEQIQAETEDPCSPIHISFSIGSREQLSTSCICNVIYADCGRDLAEWLERLTANAKIAPVLGSIPYTQWRGAADEAEYVKNPKKSEDISEPLGFYSTGTYVARSNNVSGDWVMRRFRGQNFFKYIYYISASLFCQPSHLPTYPIATWVVVFTLQRIR
jgi:hypothetical protein